MKDMVRLTTVFFLIALSVLTMVHVLAMSLYLYWQVWWLDIPVHVLGGVVVVFGFFTARDLRLPQVYRLLTWYGMLCGVLIVAIGWEVFQYLITDTLKPDYVIDTLTDIVCGLTGGVIGWYMARRIDSLINRGK